MCCCLKFVLIQSGFTTKTTLFDRQGGGMFPPLTTDSPPLWAPVLLCSFVVYFCFRILTSKWFFCERNWIEKAFSHLKKRLTSKNKGINCWDKFSGSQPLLRRPKGLHERKNSSPKRLKFVLFFKICEIYFNFIRRSFFKLTGSQPYLWRHQVVVVVVEVRFILK